MKILINVEKLYDPDNEGQEINDPTAVIQAIEAAIGRLGKFVLYLEWKEGIWPTRGNYDTGNPVKAELLAIADVFRSPELGLVSFQPILTAQHREGLIRVRKIDGVDHLISLDGCTWPTNDEVDLYWKEINKLDKLL